MRFNDGVVDHEGRYWAGTMDDPKVKEPPTDEGVLFRLDPDMSLHRMIENVSIPNGICFSPDEKTMYFIDSPTNNGKAFFGFITALLSDLQDVLCKSKSLPILLPEQLLSQSVSPAHWNADTVVC